MGVRGGKWQENILGKNIAPAIYKELIYSIKLRQSERLSSWKTKGLQGTRNYPHYLYLYKIEAETSSLGVTHCWMIEDYQVVMS